MFLGLFRKKEKGPEIKNIKIKVDDSFFKIAQHQPTEEEFRQFESTRVWKLIQTYLQYAKVEVLTKFSQVKEMREVDMIKAELYTIEVMLNIKSFLSEWLDKTNEEKKEM